MKSLTLFILSVIFAGNLSHASTFYDCESPRVEKAGSHNMVFFGDPKDELYVYHLPLFSGATNGKDGHVLMHVYQALWNIEVDAETKKAYQFKFDKEKSPKNPFPFFSISPQGKSFKVPEMICNEKFSLNASAVYGHIEGNFEYPKPEKLIGEKLSKFIVKGKTVFARRFDASAKDVLTYVVFGTPKQYYMAHYLTDDDNSYDQIVAIEISDEALKKPKPFLITVPATEQNNLIDLKLKGANHKWKLPVSPLGKKLDVVDVETSKKGRVRIIGEIYFNANDDLKK